MAGEIRSLRRRIDLEIVPMRSRLDWKAISKTRSIIKHLKPALVHIHGTRAGSVARLAAIGQNVPVIYTEHLWTKQFKLSNRITTFVHYFGNWFLDIFTNLNIAVSFAVKDFLVDSNISHLGKIKVIYNGIEPTSEEAKVLNNKDEILLMTVATLNYQKGIQYLLRALPKIIKEFPAVKLEIIGDGSYRSHLEDLTKKLKLQKNVKFIGFVSDVEKHLAKADLYVQPSISESFGLAIIQAMGVGLPIVATYAGGIPEVVTDGKSGFLVEPAKPEALEAAILDVLRNPAKAKEMGVMAKKEAKLKFNIKDMMRELETTYEAMASNTSFSF